MIWNKVCTILLKVAKTVLKSSGHPGSKLGQCKGLFTHKSDFALSLPVY